MDDTARQTIEKGVRAECDRGDYSAAATRALRGYGSEIFGFLIAVHREEQDASDVFSEVAEALWRGLPDFAWESTLRTWAYAIARNSSRMFRRGAARRARRDPRAGESALDEVAEAVRTETLVFLRTETRTRVEALRDALEPEDRMLLVLRVDRQLGWNELARVMHTESTALDDAGLTREAARLRKRFQLIKERIRELARREGIVE